MSLAPRLAGIFVGGASRRMGGTPKGLLVAEGGETIVDRWARIFGALGIPCVLVGKHPAYASCAIPRIADDPSAAGPLGGLIGLLEHACTGAVIAVACDMPYVTESLVRQLVGAAALPAAPAALASVVAARREGRWEPFFARYEVDVALPIARARAAAGELALQGLLTACRAGELALEPAEQALLRDWDTPEDVRAVTPTTP